MDTEPTSAMGLARRDLRLVNDAVLSMKTDRARTGHIADDKHVRGMNRMIPTLTSELKRLYFIQREASGSSTEEAQEGLDAVGNDIRKDGFQVRDDRLPVKEMDEIQVILWALCLGDGKEHEAPGQLIDWYETVLAQMKYILDTMDRRTKIMLERKRNVARAALSSPLQDPADPEDEIPSLASVLDPGMPTSNPASHKHRRTAASSRDQIMWQPSGNGGVATTSTTALGQQPATSTSAFGQQPATSTLALRTGPDVSSGRETRTSSRRASATVVASGSGTAPPARGLNRPTTPAPTRPLPTLKDKDIKTIEEVLEQCRFLSGDGRARRLKAADLPEAVVNAIKPHLEPFRDQEGWTELKRDVKSEAVLHCVRHKLRTKGRYGNGDGMVREYYEPCTFCRSHGVPCVRRHKSDVGGWALIVPTMLRKEKRRFDQEDPTMWVNES